MAIFIGKKQISKIQEANESVEGTRDYTKYYMETEYKNSKGVWKFIGHSVPPYKNDDGILKTVKGNTYLMIRDGRYKLRDVHKELLGLI